MMHLVEFARMLIPAGLTFTAIGTVAVLASRNPIHRQRVGELTFVAFLAWAIVAAVPRERSHAVAPVVAPAIEAVEVLAVEAIDSPDDLGPLAASIAPAAPPRAPAGDAMAWAILAGSLFTAIYLVLARIVLWWTVRRASRAPAAVVALASGVTASWFAASTPRIYASPTVRRPFCCGLVRPCIVLPARLCARGAEATLASVLRHELAHIRQHDLLTQTVTVLCWPFLYWNPLYYWLRREVRLAAELIADDIASGPATKTRYVRDLIDLVEREPDAHRMRPGTIGVFSRKTEFYRRMNMLLERKNRLAVRCSRRHLALRSACAAVLVAVGVMSWGLEARAQTDVDAPPAAPRDPIAKTKSTAPVAAPRAMTLDVEFRYTGPAQLGAAMTAFADGGFAVMRFNLAPAQGASRIGRARLRCAAPDAVQRLQAVMPAGPTIVKVTKRTPRTRTAVVSQAKPMPPTDASKRLNLSFTAADIRKVLSTIAKLAGTNIIIAPDVKGSITLQLHGVSWRAAVDAAVRALGYTVIDEGTNLIRVVAER